MLRKILDTLNEIRSPASRGLAFGAATGFGLALAYSVLASLVWLWAAPFVFLLGLPCVVAATIVGGITGWLIGGIFEKANQYLTSRTAALVGAAVCIAIALTVNIPCLLFANDGAELMVGIPSLIYSIAGVWMSVKLYREARFDAVSKPMNAIVSASLLALLLSGWWIFIYINRAEQQAFLIPQDYTGMIAVAFDEQLGGPAKYEGVFRIYDIPDRGVLFTQPYDPRSYTVSFYFIDSRGNRSVIPYFYECQGTEIPHDKIIVCGQGQQGIFNVEGRQVLYKVYFIGHKANNQVNLQVFDRRTWYDGDEVDELFPEK